MANLLSTTVNGQLNTGNVIDLGYTVNGTISTTAFRGINFHSFGDYQYLIGKRAGAWTQPLDITFYTGIKYHAHQAYGGHKFYTGGFESNFAFSIGDGDANVRVENNLYIGSSGGWITDLLAAKQNASTAINTGNIGSQSVSFATSAGALTSMNISQFTNNSGYITSSASITGNAASATFARRIAGPERIGFNVGGDPGVFYPIAISTGAGSTESQYSEFIIERGGYDDPGYSGIGFSTFNARFTYKPSGWGYGATYFHLEQLAQTATMLGDFVDQYQSSQAIIWLRGATRYNIYSVYGGIGLIFTNEGGTSYSMAYGTYDPISTPREKATTAKYYDSTVRYAGTIYTGSNAVIHAGNIGSQSVNYATSAGSATTATTAGSLTSMNISQFTNNSGYITGISFANVSSKPTTISGYGITDAITTSNIGSQSVNYATSSSVSDGLGTSFLGNGSTNISSGFSRVIRNENGLGGNLNYAPVLHLAASDTMWQIAGGHAGSTNLQWRSGYAGTWSTPWWTILHTGNYTSFAPSLTGTGASGTWGISITGNANTATTAGSAPNAGNINPFYNVTAGIGNGLRFWSGDDSYKISMGVGSLYQYGPVIDYSIKTQMDPGSTGRGFTWGNNGVTPVAALNATSGNFQVAGTIANGSVWINNGANYNNYDENIRLFDAPNGVSVIAFSASGTGGSPKTSILGFSSYLETRVSDTWEQRIYGGYVEARGSMRAPIFYDSQDTAYYGDFGSTSRFNATITNTSYFGADTNKGYAQGFNTYSSSLHKIAYVSFDWNGNYDAYSNHGIASTDFNGNFADSVSINSYNDITFRLDSNNNNGDSYVRFMNDTTGNNTFSSIGYNGSTYYASFSRDLYVTGNTGGSFGNRLIIGATTTPHTLQDANVRPTAYLRGPYPVLTLDHTETNNGEHGPTIQFTFNGSNARQWVIGCGGSGNHMDFGFSSSGYGNTNYNPHNGISGYLGNTIMRIIDSRVGIGGDWGAYGSVANPEHTLDVRGTIFSNTDMRAPIFYDSNNTGYYGDFAGFSRMSEVGVTNNYVYNYDSIESPRAVAEFGVVGKYVATRSAVADFPSFSFENVYGNHSWGIMARFHIRQSGADRPSIQISSGSSNDRWNIGFCTGTDNNFRISQNMGYRPDGSGATDGWGTERFRINTDGTAYLQSTIYTHEISHTNGRVSLTGNLHIDSYNGNDIYMNYYSARGTRIYVGSGTLALHVNTDGLVYMPTVVVNSHSDNTKGYRIHNTSGSSVSAMFTNSSNQLVIAAGAVDQINLNKKVYVNAVALGVNFAPSATAGRIDASNDIVAFNSSDERLKENITPIANALNKVKSLTGVEFDWKPEHKEAHGHEGRDTGIIAQQVLAVMPTAVRTNDTGFLAVRYEKLIGLLIEANKELAARVEELEKKIG